MAVLESTNENIPNLPVSPTAVSLVISVISIIVSVSALLLAYWRYKEQKRQGQEIKRQSDELERQGNEIERQSKAMENEFTTDIFVENSKPVINKLELWVSNLGYGRGKHLEVKTRIIVDEDESYTQPHRKSLERVDSEENRSSCVIEDGEEMVKFEVEPLIRVDLPDSECQNMSIPSGVEQLKEYTEDKMEIDIKLCDTDPLENESETQVFDTPQILFVEEVDEYPSLESMINRGEY